MQWKQKEVVCGRKSSSFCCWGCRFQVGEALIGQVQRVLEQPRPSLNFELSLRELGESQTLASADIACLCNCCQHRTSIVALQSTTANSSALIKHFQSPQASLSTLHCRSHSPHSCSDDVMCRLQSCLWEANCIRWIGTSNYWVLCPLTDRHVGWMDWESNLRSSNLWAMQSTHLTTFFPWSAIVDDVTQPPP